MARPKKADQSLAIVEANRRWLAEQQRDKPRRRSVAVATSPNPYTHRPLLPSHLDRLDHVRANIAALRRIMPSHFLERAEWELLHIDARSSIATFNKLMQRVLRHVGHALRVVEPRDP